LLISFLCFSEVELKCQLKYSSLFLGNSYTSFNNLPQMVHDVALSAGDTLVFDSYSPGGYQLADHNIDMTSQNKIMAGGWNYVVLQGQSQEPVVHAGQFMNGGVALYNLVKQYNPCAVTMPYMTWGRKNGDPSTCAAFPMTCTYQLMDSTLRSRYLSLTEVINGEVSPVSVVWRFLRQNYPNLDLYQADESHPSVAGTYAAACCFYTSIFKKDPTTITLNPGLSAGDAAIIRSAAKTQVFDSLQLWDFKKLPVSHIGYQIGSGINQVIFTPVSQGVRQNYYWDFGDGATTTTVNPTHSYSANGTYTVSLTTSNCDLQGMHSSFSDTVIRFCSHTPTVYTSHGWLCNYDTLWTQAADSYQWFSNGVPLPETNQYLANYSSYNISGFSVISKLNGCSELSKTYSKTPEWSGYYFDAIGDPCSGDTVAFAALHANGFLSGQENILWFKNNMLLASMSNEDTLFISAPGKYACKIVNPFSNCPFDTTSSVIEYDCGPVTGIAQSEKLHGVVFPNPASVSITIKSSGENVNEPVAIYSAAGQLVKVMKGSGSNTYSIGDLPAGFYFIRLNSQQRPLKFIKQ
jgi:hypothetical protein